MTPTVNELERQAAEARAQHQAAQQRLGTALADASAERTRRRLAVYQDWIDRYDPAALRAAKAETDAALRAALARGGPDLGPALGNFWLAIWREHGYSRLAEQCVHTHGATPPKNMTVRALGVSFAGGGGMDVDREQSNLLVRLAIEEATRKVEQEVAAVHAAAEAAYASVDARTPAYYKVTYPSRGTFADQLGSITINVVDGVGYVPADLEQVIAFLRTRPGFTLTEVYSVPTEHTEFVRLLRTELGEPVNDVRHVPASGDPIHRHG